MTKSMWIVVGLIVVGVAVLIYLFRQPPPAGSPESVMATTTAMLTSIPSPAPTPKRYGEDYYRMYALDGVTYDALARDTERYEKKIIPLAGTVLQVVEQGKGAVMRLAVDGDSDHVVIVNFPGYSTQRVLVDDKVRMYGTVLGRVDYQTVLGQKVTAPALEAGWLVRTRG